MNNYFTKKYTQVKKISHYFIISNKHVLCQLNITHGPFSIFRSDQIPKERVFQIIKVE